MESRDYVVSAKTWNEANAICKNFLKDEEGCKSAAAEAKKMDSDLTCAWTVKPKTDIVIGSSGKILTNPFATLKRVFTGAECSVLDIDVPKDLVDDQGKKIKNVKIVP